MDAMTSNSLKLDPVKSKAAGLESASICSLSVALWGWQTGLLFAAIPIICLLEARRIIKQRWEFSLDDLKEAAKLSSAILAILFVVLITTKKSLFIYSLFQWLPVAGLPFLLAQTYGLGVPALLSEWFSNPHLFRRGIRTKQNFVNLYHIYFGLCIAAASATQSDHFFFYGAATGLIAIFLWSQRPKRSTPILWALMFCLSVGLGFAGHIQLSHFQRQLEAQMIAMIGNIASGAVNPNGNATQMGSVGRLKLSNKIAFRVAPALDSGPSTEDTSGSSTFPLLLQEASYNQYQLSAWSAVNSLFDDVPPGTEEGDWVLGPSTEQDRSIIISTDLDRGDGVLTLPRGTSSIQQLPVAEMQRNQYGAVQVDATGNAAYRVNFGPIQSTNLSETRPTKADLQIPNVDKSAIETTLSRLSLANQSEQEIVSQIAAYFQDFQYSLELLRPQPNTSPVSDFLLNTQAGHCEYFASATALLLRGAGIPARYAVGYSAHEFSSLEGQYIVRSRDAHAWTLVYLDGSWQILDTTPPDWAAQERAMTSRLQAIPDFFSFLGFQVSYRVRQLGDLGLREVLLIVIPLFCYLLWRSTQAFKGQRQNALELDSERLRPTPDGLDSEFYQIEKVLVEKALGDRNLSRLPTESLLQWRDRIQSSLPEPQQATLTEILTLHYRYRFDPQSLSRIERQQLQTQSQQWIAAYLAAETETLSKH